MPKSAMVFLFFVLGLLVFVTRLCASRACDPERGGFRNALREVEEERLSRSYIDDAGGCEGIASLWNASAERYTAFDERMFDFAHRIDAPRRIAEEALRNCRSAITMEETDG